MMPLARGRENAESGVFFDGSLGRCHEHEMRLVELADREHGRDALAFGELQEVHDRLAARAPARERQLVHLEPVALPAVGEAQERVVAVRDEELVDEVLVLDGRRHLALAAAPLGFVVGDRLRLRIARVRQRDDEVLALDQVLDRDVGLVGDDLRAPGVAIRPPSLP